MEHIIRFPKMGLEFTVNEVAFRVGNFSVRWYGVIIAIGFLLALLYGFKSCKKMNIDSDKLVDVIIAGVIGGIIGARLFYVAFYPGDKYINDPIQILKIYEGGLAFYGGLIGALLFGGIMIKIRKLNLGAVFDLVALGFLIGQAVGRWGNFVNQEAFGTATDLPWGMVSETTQMVVIGNVHPCFLYESILCLIGFIALHFFTRKARRYDGQTFILYVMWYGLSRFFIESLRTDSLLTPGVDLRISMVIGGASVVIGAIMLIIFRKRTKLSGCGNKKVMEMNGLLDDSEPITAVEEDEYSTIFGDLDKKETSKSKADDNDIKDTSTEADKEAETTVEDEKKLEDNETIDKENKADNKEEKENE